jgi:hypothetical protein
MIKYVVCSITCLLFLGSCGEGGTAGADKEEQPLAQAAGQYLYPSTIEGIGAGMTKTDSLYQLKVYTEQWIRDQLMLDVANNNVTVTAQIERMVEAYEATLIMNEYEEALINQRLNTEVTPQELADYYSNNKEQYQAGISWVRCHFVKAKRGTPELQTLKKWFKSDDGVDFERVKLFCAKHKTVHILNEDLWIEYEKLVKELPKDAIGNRHRKNQSILDRMDENHQYLLQIFEYRDKEDAAPLPQVQDEIKRIILHQRRNKILQNIRKEVYEKAKKEGTFEIF